MRAATTKPKGVGYARNMISSLLFPQKLLYLLYSIQNFFENFFIFCLFVEHYSWSGWYVHILTPPPREIMANVI
jgi:hypothetical protein